MNKHCFLTLLALATAAGCADSPYELASVTGVVTLDGELLTEGKVMFTPVASGETAKAGKPGYGPLQSDGKYTVSTYSSSDGAIVGKHWISVIQTVIPNSPAGADPNSVESVKFNRYKIPEQKAVVADQENKIDIALTSAMLSE